MRLDSVAFMRQGGDSGSILAKRDGGIELLLERVTADAEDRMPPEGEPLTKDQVDLIRHWLSAGAPAPLDDSPEEDPAKHWAFQPVERPSIPDLGINRSRIQSMRSSRPSWTRKG